MQKAHHLGHLQAAHQLASTKALSRTTGTVFNPNCHLTTPTCRKCTDSDSILLTLIHSNSSKEAPGTAWHLTDSTSFKIKSSSVEKHYPIDSPFLLKQSLWMQKKLRMLHLQRFKARLDGALGTLVEWVAALLTAVGLEQNDLWGFLQPNSLYHSTVWHLILILIQKSLANE